MKKAQDHPAGRSARKRFTVDATRAWQSRAKRSPRMDQKKSKPGKGKGQGSKAQAKAKGQRKEKNKKGNGKKSMVMLQRGLQIDAAVHHGFWNAFVHRSPIALRTSFGNYSIVNTVDRFQITAVTYDQLLWLPWSPTAVSAFMMEYDPVSPATANILATVTSALTGNSYGPGNNVPLSLRPMRFSCRITSTTKNVNATGGLYIASIDAPLQLTSLFTAVSTDASAFNSATLQMLTQIATDGLDSKFHTAVSLQDTKLFNSVPAHWMAYNTYHKFVPFRTRCAAEPTGSLPRDHMKISNGDMYAFAAGDRTVSSTNADAASYPSTAPSSSLIDLFGTPPMRGFIIYIPAAAGSPGTSILNESQTYTIEVAKQFGARYSTGSLGHSFHRQEPHSTTQQENAILKSVGEMTSHVTHGIADKAMERVRSAAIDTFPELLGMLGG